VDVLGNGVYSIAQAARLTGLRSRRVRDWFIGRPTPSRPIKQVFESDYPAMGGEHAISFLDLVELFIGGQLREMGVSLPYLRTAYTKLEDRFGQHPFCTREILVGGKEIFYRELDDLEAKRIIQAVTEQPYFETIILPFLKNIDYDDATMMASRWRIARDVVVDPRRRFGKPIVDEVGISTSVLWSSFYANGENDEAVAEWFGIERRHVMAAVSFEDGLAA
jgi:uncharacterized protein (DUF433 family)